MKKTKPHAIIQKLPYKDKQRCNQRSKQDNLQKSQIQQNQTQKYPQVERKRIYIGNLNKNSSEEDLIAEIFGLRATPYLLENCFIEMPTGSKNRNYAFITAPEHACHKLIKLNDVTFQDMCLKLQKAVQYQV